MRGVNRQPKKVIRVSQIDLIESDSDDEDVSSFPFLTLIRSNSFDCKTGIGETELIWESFVLLLTLTSNSEPRKSFVRIY